MRTWGRQVISISLLGFAACSSNSGTPEATPAPAAPRTTTARPPSTTTTISRYSFDNSVPPPELVNTGTNYKNILQSLLDYSNWTLAHRPERALAENVTAPGSKSQAGMTSDARILRRFDRRLYETYNGPSSLTILDANTSSVSAAYTQDIKQQAVVDRSGTVVSHRSLGLTTYNVLMVKLGDGRWYLASVAQRKESNVNL